MKKIRLFTIFCVIMGLMAGCSNEKEAEQTELIVFGAASMTETLSELDD